MCFRNSIQIQLVLFFLYVTDVTSACRSQVAEKRSTKCILPRYPNYGFYEVAGDPEAKPGDELEYVYLNVSCEYDHGVIGNNVVICILGEWSTIIPECVPLCRLREDPSVTYSCKNVDAEEFRACGEYEPLGATAKAVCRSGYYSRVTLPQMQCVSGSWTTVALCVPECGIMPDNGTLPWYAYIYRKQKTTKSVAKYRPICGGTIIGPNIVLSARHCFWNPSTRAVESSEHVVVAGKKYLGDISDEEIFPVSEVKVTEHSHEQRGYHHVDIATVIISKAFTYSRKLHPICLDFDFEFQKQQMWEGNLGTVGVLPFPMVDQALLQVSKISYMPWWKCTIQASNLQDIMTEDKFCASLDNGTSICRGNRGTGLAFPDTQRGITRYYLRGVVSGTPSTEQLYPPKFITLTDVQSLKYVIKERLAASLRAGSMAWLEPEGFVGCHLREHPSVTYSCKTPDAKEFRPCGEYERSGATAKATCRSGYYSPVTLPRMWCVNGTWANVVQCTPECGIMPDNATLPWYAYIYKKNGKTTSGFEHYQPMCGGSVISPNIVISAGHCLWQKIESTHMAETSEYVVITGKEYWRNIGEEEKYPVAGVKVPEQYQGVEGNLQHDIALFILSKAFTYSRKLHPICLDFDLQFKKKQMQAGTMGTVGIFPFPMVDQSLLQVKKIPYMPAQECIAQVPPHFTNMVTEDKFCAGLDNRTLICPGNSGTGLAFPETHRGITRYYLRGIVSSAPRTEKGEACGPLKLITLTDVFYHENFITEHLVTSLPPRMLWWWPKAEDFVTRE